MRSSFPSMRARPLGRFSARLVQAPVARALAVAWVAGLAACSGERPAVAHSAANLAASPTQSTPALFPERPELQGLAPEPPFAFKQETWTAAPSGLAQHCHEWAVPRAQEATLRDGTNARLGALGFTGRLGGMLREDGIALFLGDAPRDGDELDLTKLVVCTERHDTAPALTAFVAAIGEEARARVGDSPVPLHGDAAWDRRYATGRRRIGMRLANLDAATARPLLLDGRFVAAGTQRDGEHWARGRERVTVIGDRVWWQLDVPNASGATTVLRLGER